LHARAPSRNVVMGGDFTPLIIVPHPLVPPLRVAERGPRGEVRCESVKAAHTPPPSRRAETPCTVRPRPPASRRRPPAPAPPARGGPGGTWPRRARTPPSRGGTRGRKA